MLDQGLNEYARLIRNLQTLERRNPDFAVLLGVVDSWLERYLGSVPSDDSSEETASIHVTEPVLGNGDIGSVDVPSEHASSETSGGTATAVGTNPSGMEFRSASSTEGSSSGLGTAQAASSMSLLNPAETEQLEKRLILKIEASRWALERDKLLKANVDFQSQIEPRDHDLLARARELTNCYLWMNNPETAPVVATETYELLADAYASTAQCVGFMRRLIERYDKAPRSEVLCRILRDALYITATAQSALRRVTYEVSGREDQDQIRIHRWLTLLTKKYSIYVNRHMKKNSLAPVEKIYLIPEYIKRLEEQLEKLGQKQKVLSEGFRRIQYHAARINENNSAESDWNRIICTVDDLVDAGIRVTDPRFAELLHGILPYLQKVPSYAEHPSFVSVLLDLDYWRNDPQELARVQQELAQLPPILGGDLEGGDSGLEALWNDSEDGSEDEASVETAPLRDSSDSSEAPESESFGFGILDSEDASGKGAGTDTVSAIGTVSRPIPTRPGIQSIPSYAGVVSERAKLHPNMDARGVEEMLEETCKSVAGRVLLLVDGTGDTALKSQLEADVKVSVCFADSGAIQSESFLTQLVHPGTVAVVLMVEESVPTSNRTVENYCRHFDKPLLRIARGASVSSVARQIQAALSLYS